MPKQTRNINTMTTDELVALVERAIERHSQVERDQVFKVLTELDKEKTNFRFMLEEMRGAIRKEINDAHEDLERVVKEDQVRCQGAFSERITFLHDKRQDDFKERHDAFKAMETVFLGKIEESKPNYWNIVGFVLLPLLGWMLTMQIMVSQIRSELTLHTDPLRTLAPLVGPSVASSTAIMPKPEPTIPSVTVTVASGVASGAR